MPESAAAIARLVLFLLGVLALFMLIPLVMAIALGEKAMVFSFGIPAGALFCAGLGASIPGLLRRIQGKSRAVTNLHTSDGFILVFVGWLAVCLAGAIPFALSGCFDTLGKAVFESVSGFTTTGSTMMSDVAAAPRSLVMWRGLSHWIGGMGIVVLTVALLPMLGVNAFSLMDAESPGPETDRIVPRMTRTAKILWGLYVALTVIQTILLRLGGMPWYDALFNSFSTMGTGGFACRNDSIAAYHSPYAEWVIIVFMLIAGFNFTLIYQALQGRFKEITRNSEARGYALIVCIAIVLAGVSLGGDKWRQAAFHTASIITTTGFSVANQDAWPALAQCVLFMLMFIGGCSGSTAGGIKVIRHIVLWKQTGNEMKKLLYPRGVFSIRLNGAVGSRETVKGVAGFVFVYLLLAFISFIVVASSGLGLFESLNLSLICLGNIGLGFSGGAGGSDALLQQLPEWQKWYLSLIMIAGRLELWSVFVFLSRDYWRR